LRRYNEEIDDVELTTTSKPKKKGFGATLGGWAQ
jgi:hypothetical protein